MPIQRTFALLIALSLALAALVPLAAPAPTRAVSTTVTLSEAYGGGGNSGATLTHDFIELRNLTDAPIDLAGLSLQYASATGTGSFGAHDGQLTELSGTIPAGGYFLVQEAPGSGGTTALPQPDLVDPTPIGMAGGAGKVALVTGTDSLGCNGGSTPCNPNQLSRIVDLVGWGNANFFEGSGPAPGTGNTTSVQRIDDGTTDTDDNAADFTSGTPTPQNAGGGNAPTDPTGTGSADPASVEPGGTATLTVEVTPGTNPTSTGTTVSADLSAISDAGAATFTQTAGTNTFTYVATVDADTAAGSYDLPVTITDAQERIAETTIALVVRGEATRICEIQGAGHLSPLDGNEVFGVEGIVTATSGGGFWMTDPGCDSSDATSDGIFVFRGEAAVGDLVSVDGRVDEFRVGFDDENLTLTEIVSPTVTVLAGENDLPTTVIGVDRLPPTIVIDDDSAISVEADDAVFDPVNDGVDFWESLEGMRLEIASAVAVGPTNRFGEIAVISQLQPDAGVRTPRGGLLVRELGPDGDYRPGDFNPERVILDDGMERTPDVNTGDAFTVDPIGVLDYSFGNFKLLLSNEIARVDNGLVREVTAEAGPRDLTVATFNVENLSPLDNDAKVAELASQIVNNLRSPDIIGIEEMQDNTGDIDEGGDDGTVAADQSWQRLIEAIVAAGGPRYDYRQIDPENNVDGGVPGGNIRVGFLFDESAGLKFIDRPGGDATKDTDVVPAPNGRDAQLTLSPGRVLDSELAGDKAFADTRKSLAGEFRFRGESLFVVVNHFSSKGDDRPLFGRYQPPYRLTEFESGNPEDGWRHAQAQAINDFVDEILAVDADAHVIVLGDINDFDFSETVEILTGERIALDALGDFDAEADGSGPTRLSGEATVMSTLFDTLPENERYSYVFDGNSQVLDQILVSNSLRERNPTYDVVHVNAEFFDQASDHDPSVMTVSFHPRPVR